METEVEVSITLPPPLSFLPSFILRQAGGLVLKAVASTMLPRFGALVAEDYRRWANDEPRIGGSLAFAMDNHTKMAISPPSPYTPPPTALPPP
mmetsp:Transcript_41966/g.65572  ORF Transcript_41966/g.65572 Transcript_41966/m.65572 type:complete len:93 (+) Transcript_41966:200-478(+)